MASNMKEIKERVVSVKNTSQITTAMNVISSTKFKKFQELTLKSRDYSETLNVAFDNLVASLKKHNHVLFDGKVKVKKIGIVVMTSDKGLCGSFNSSTLKKLDEVVKNFKNGDKEVSVIAIGRKIKDYCKSKKIKLDSGIDQLIPEIMFEEGKKISEEIVKKYLDDDYDEVYLLFSKFISAIKYSLQFEKVLPIEKKEGLPTDHEYIFEPSEEVVLREFIPKVFNIKLYQSLLENTASEHSARMTAMQQASDNAEDMINKLTIEYNRVRQGEITQELTEIVGGAEALK